MPTLVLLAEGKCFWVRAGSTLLEKKRWGEGTVKGMVVGSMHARK